jgi:hypothetical protein
LILPVNGKRKREVRILGAHHSVVGGDDAEVKEVKENVKPQLQSVIICGKVEEKKEEELGGRRYVRSPLAALFVKQNLLGKTTEVAIGECIVVTDVDGEPVAKRYKR